MRAKSPIPKLGIGHSATTPSPPLWIPAFAGMTKWGAGMTKCGAGMTNEESGITSAGAVVWGQYRSRVTSSRIGV